MTDLHDAGADGVAANDELRAALESAFDAPPPEETGTTDTPRADADAEPEKADDRPRDAHGRFAPKDKDDPSAPEDASTPADASTASDGTAPAATRKMPSSWKPDHQPLWDQLTPAHQDLILKREEDVSKGFQEKAERTKRYEAHQELIDYVEQHAGEWSRLGVRPVEAFQQLRAAQDYIRQDPINGIRWLAQELRLHPMQVAQALGIPVGQPQQQGHPAQAAQQPAADPLHTYVGQLAAHVNALTQKLTIAEQAELARRNQAALDTVNAFVADPANEYANLVGDQMMEILEHPKFPRTGNYQQDLKTAYDRAVWLNEEARAALIAKREQEAARAAAQTATQTTAQQQAAVRAQADAVERAKRAGSSIKGAPTGGVPAPKHASLREELESAFGT